MPHHHVQPAAAAALLDGDVQPGRGDEGVEHARPVAFVAGDFVARVPLVRDAGEQRPEQRLHAVEVAGRQPPAQGGAVARAAPPVRRQRRQQAPVQALPHFPVRIPQSVRRLLVDVLGLHDGQVAGLEQQRFDRHGVHVEGRQQLFVAAQAVERRDLHPALQQGVDQERRGGGLEPVGAEPAAAEQLEETEGVVHLLRPRPVVAVVPLADRGPVQARQLRAEDRVEVRVGVAADGGVVRVQGDVGEGVQPREQAHLGELADAGQEGELDPGVAVLDRRVQPAQAVAVGAGGPRLVQSVQDRLVVLVHEHRDPRAGARAQRFDQAAQAHRGARAADGPDAGPRGDVVDLRRRGLLQKAALLEVPAAEAQPHHGMPLRPVPGVVNRQSPEQRLGAFEQLLQRVHEQALAEPPRA